MLPKVQITQTETPLSFLPSPSLSLARSALCRVSQLYNDTITESTLLPGILRFKRELCIHMVLAFHFKNTALYNIHGSFSKTTMEGGKSSNSISTLRCLLVSGGCQPLTSTLTSTPPPETLFLKKIAKKVGKCSQESHSAKKKFLFSIQSIDAELQMSPSELMYNYLKFNQPR